MSQYDPLLFRDFPEGVVLACGGVVTGVNPAAEQFFPGLRPGMALPARLEQSGPLSAGGRDCLATVSRAGQEQFILLRPAPVQVQPLSDGVLTQLRALTGELMAELGPRTDPTREDFLGCDLVKSLHRLFRLVDNADFCAGGQAAFRPVTLDLVGLCRRLTDEAGDLLAEAGVQLSFDCKLPSLLMSGDGDLLRKLLLELISNGAKAAPGGRVALSLTRAPAGAVLSVSDSGGPEGVQRLARAMAPRTAPAIPRPDQGAGLGLSIVRRIAALHGGSLLSDCSGPVPRLMVSLPVGRITPNAGVRSPILCTDGGLDPTLTALSDVLPAHIFGLEGMD